MGANSQRAYSYKARFPGAVVRRAVAVSVFEACHIAPSHRRYPHPLWMDSFSLIVDLLLGCGVGRYLGCLQGPAFEQVVALRGFSAGSFSGLCLLHILWPIPGVVTKSRLGAIACPPALLTMDPAKDGDELYLVHYESDELCCWKPGRVQLGRCSDENGCLAVLHNRNKMVTTFGNSEWVTQAEGSVQSKSVTSYAGMTAHLVLLAQTRVGFLSGGRSKNMRDLPPAEFLAQLGPMPEPQ